MADRDEPLTPSTTSRRDFLKKSAATGAVLWAAPTVVSRPAFAQTGGSPVPCGAPDVCETNVIVATCGTSPGGFQCETWSVNGECDCVVRDGPFTGDEVLCRKVTSVRVDCPDGTFFCVTPCEDA